jgi:hypothetical protein
MTDKKKETICLCAELTSNSISENFKSWSFLIPCCPQMLTYLNDIDDPASVYNYTLSLKEPQGMPHKCYLMRDIGAGAQSHMGSKIVFDSFPVNQGALDSAYTSFLIGMPRRKQCYSRNVEFLVRSFARSR